jgi:hypothetical protein
MGKIASKKPAKKAAAAWSRNAKVAGVTADGVAILRLRGRATHFTQREVDRAVATVLAARSQESDGAKKPQPKRG